MIKFSDSLRKISAKLQIKWKLNPRPYSDEETEKLLKNLISKETATWHYRKHHKGYVDTLNKIEKLLQKVDLTKANGNYSELGELKRRQTWNHSGALLHDIYWDNLGGDGNPKRTEILKAIKENWGSFNEWKKDFIASALATKLSGWAILIYDQLYSKKLMNIIVDEHNYGAIWGGIPLIACDMFEHSYYHKNGPDRKTYIENFIKNLHWERIEKNYLKIK